MYTLCTINEQLLQAKTSTILNRSLLHNNDIGVYVALQLILVIVVFDHWRQALIPYSYRQAPPECFYMLWDASPDIDGTDSFTWYESHKRYIVSDVGNQVFTPYNYSSTARIRTPDLCTTRPTCFTTSPSSKEGLL